MKQNKHSTKKNTTKEILDLLGIPTSEEQINDNDYEKINQTDNNEIHDKEENKKACSIEKEELNNIEEELSLFEKE